MAVRAFGSQGRNVPLRSNHFELRFDGSKSHLQKWLAWQVDVTVAASAKGRGKARGKGTEEPREPPKKLRDAAVCEFLKDLPKGTWLYDGSHRLYTSCSRAWQPPPPGNIHLPEARDDINVNVQGAEDQRRAGQQVIDLSRIVPGSDTDAVAEEARFLQVALRKHATEEQGLIARGRKTVCPNLQLSCPQEQAMLCGREVWMGYMALLQLVDGQRGSRFTLNLNLVGSVGLREMPAIDLLAFFLAGLERRKGYSKHDWSRYLQSGQGEREIEQHRRVFESATGLRDLKVKYGRSYLKYEKTAKVKGLTVEPASHYYFEHPQYGWLSVKDYFKAHYGYELTCPHLPCLQLQTRNNCVPIELVTVLGGEHNILSGKLKPEYQAAVGKVTTMIPQRRQQEIMSLMSGSNRAFGPCEALQKIGIDVQTEMLSLTGRVLDRTNLQQGHNKDVVPNGYANHFSAIAPPSFEVRWGIWCYARGGDERDLDNVISEWVNKGWHHNIRFANKPWPRKWKTRLEHDEELKKELQEVHEAQDRPHLLLVLLPANKDDCKCFYGSLKTWTELELRSFATQCVNCTGKRDQSELEAVKLKFNNLMIKVTAKLPQKADGTGAAHNVELWRPHPILKPAAGTMVIGADVTHDGAGVSVAGVVASGDASLSTYLSNLRAQTPFVLDAQKQRRRQSEERIVELGDMVKELLWLWNERHDALPENIIYYRDGVSYGQFTPVLTYELNELTKAFGRFGGGGYKPKLVIIVGQKRHHTRFFVDDANFSGGGASGSGTRAVDAWNRGKGSDMGKGGGKDFGGKGGSKGYGGGKGYGEQPAHLEPGTVAGEGIAVPGHLNFFLVSHKGLKGTAVPCHYHVLHKDPGLRLGVDDLERITYDLCHLYSRADKTVSYASPAYMADHLCERGKLYLETLFPALDDSSWSAAPSGFSDEEAERRFREKVNERCAEFNNKHAWKLTYGKTQHSGETQQGRNYFC